MTSVLQVLKKVELLEANPNYAHIRHENGRESTVSLRDIAPYVEQPTVSNPDQYIPHSQQPECNSGLEFCTHDEVADKPAQEPEGNTDNESGVEHSPGDTEEGKTVTFGDFHSDNPVMSPVPVPGFVRRSSRISKPPARFSPGEK